MQLIKDFLRRHVFWSGLIGAGLPLSCIIGLQYLSLATLKEALPIVQREQVWSFLDGIATEVENEIRTRAFKCLQVAPEMLQGQPTGGYPAYPEIEKHFREQPLDLARRYFIGVTGRKEDESYALVLFFNPEKGVLEPGPNTPDWGAAHGASANWLVHRMTNTPVPSSALSVDERYPETRLIVNPILKDAQVQGVTGMILNESYVLEQILHPIISAAAEEFRSSQRIHLDASVIGGDGTVILGAPLPPDQLSIPLKFVFADWQIGSSLEQLQPRGWQMRFSAMNFLLSILLTIAAVAAVILTLRAAADAMKLSQMKTEFVSNVSHELRTPVSSIRVFGEFLREGRTNDFKKIGEYGFYIETESRRLMQLIDNILDFSKIESGKKTYEFEETHLEKLVLETIDAFSARSMKRDIKILFERPQEALPPLMVDRNAITHALANLLDNAVKYSGESKEINVRLSRGSSTVAIAVIDQGIGIPHEEQSRIFDKFYRVSTGFVHDVRGTGLGLSIVRHIVEAHDGEVMVRSEPGLGSTFTIHLPLSRSRLGTAVRGK